MTTKRTAKKSIVNRFGIGDDTPKPKVDPKTIWRVEVGLVAPTGTRSHPILGDSAGFCSCPIEGEYPARAVYERLAESLSGDHRSMIADPWENVLLLVEQIHQLAKKKGKDRRDVHQSKTKREWER